MISAKPPSISSNVSRISNNYSARLKSRIAVLENSTSSQVLFQKERFDFTQWLEETKEELYACQQ